MQGVKRSSIGWVVAMTGLFAACGNAAGESDGAGNGAPAGERADTAPRLDPRLAAVLPEGVTLDMVAEGRRSFHSVCAVCHGPGGAGTQLGPSLRDSEWLHISGGIGEIETLIRTGVPLPEAFPIPMPVLGGGAFAEDELHAVSAYVYALRYGAR